MSGAAGLAKQAGFEVSGSDKAEVYDPVAEVLEQNGIDYYRGYDSSHIYPGPSDLFIVSAGEDQTNPEVAALLEHQLSYFSFAELAQSLAADKIRIVVAGTHGKSTTAGMLGHTLRHIDDSSFLVGGVLTNYQSNFYSGEGHYFIFEGDEYRATFDDPTPKFHYYKADIAVLTNLEFDHPDIFRNVEEIKEEFAQLLEALPEDGIFIYSADDHELNDLAFRFNLRNFSYGIDNPADVTLVQARYLPNHTELDVLNNIRKNGGVIECYQTQLKGEINVRNALAAITTLRAIGFEPELVAAYLKTYTGISRRFEMIGEHNNIVVIDDYAHHPTAVAQTLKAARVHFPERRIWAVFEPHTFSRTHATLPELASAFSNADLVLITDIYPARESVKTASISSQEVIDAVRKQHKHARLTHEKNDTLTLLKQEAKPGDLIVVMAVGNFNRLGYELLEALRA